MLSNFLFYQAHVLSFQLYHMFLLLVFSWGDNLCWTLLIFPSKTKLFFVSPLIKSSFPCILLPVLLNMTPSLHSKLCVKGHRNDISSFASQQQYKDRPLRHLPASLPLPLFIFFLINMDWCTIQGILMNLFTEGFIVWSSVIWHSVILGYFCHKPQGWHLPWITRFSET